MIKMDSFLYVEICRETLYQLSLTIINLKKI